MNDEFDFNARSTMNEAEINFLQDLLSKSKNYLEYGSGFSTIEACKLVKNQIVSVETNAEYINFLKEQISKSSLQLSKVEFIHASIGETSEWGYPANLDLIAEWPKYSLAGDAGSQYDITNIDLALIDGRFRVATFVYLYLRCPRLKIVFDDYVDRPHYHVIQELLNPKIIQGRIAVFQVPRIKSRGKQLLAVQILLRHLLDPQ